MTREEQIESLERQIEEEKKKAKEKQEQLKARKNALLAQERKKRKKADDHNKIVVGGTIRRNFDCEFLEGDFLADVEKIYSSISELMGRKLTHEDIKAYKRYILQWKNQIKKEIEKGEWESK